MKLLLSLLAGFLIQSIYAAEEGDTGLWITGNPFIENDVLLFKTDKPVQDNPAGDVVLLGTTKPNEEMLQILCRVAQKHLTVRLYGELQKFEGKVPKTLNPMPNVQFLAWKIHMPTDPDELPPDQKIIVKPGDKLKFKEN